MSHTSYEEDKIFEDEVRRIARCLWPLSEYGGAAMVKGHETDGVFETEECIHLIEATTSRHKSKAADDVKKLQTLAEEFRRAAGTRAIKCWFITQSEPTADQRSVLARSKGTVNMLSFNHFQSKLINASAYLSNRMNFRFGSVRDPVTGVVNPKTDYIALDLVETSVGNVWGVPRMTAQLLNGDHFVLLGDYGAGKSMTMRAIFQELRKTFLKGSTTRFPVFINMRDHFGQTDPAEVLERHARQVGFTNPGHLVRAWLAGYAILLIDGFDEVTSLGVQGVWRKLRDTRYQSMEAIRKFVRDTPKGSGIVISRRPQFFDSTSERDHALALDNSFIFLNINEFTEQQLREFLTHAGHAGNIPSWMPGRPLLVAYLVARGLIEAGDGKTDVSREEGWHNLLERIANREAEIEAGIDGSTVRRVLERLATKARISYGGLGPITTDQIIEAFKEICGYLPGSEAMVLLQRLPGLGVDTSNPENRIFVDADYADTCRAGDVVQCIGDPFNFEFGLFDKSECCLDELGVSVATMRLLKPKIAEGKMAVALQFLHDHEANGTLRTDVVRIATARGDKVQNPTHIRDIILDSWDLGSIKGDVSMVTFQECYLVKVELDEDVNPNILPRFRGCVLGQIEGRTEIKDLPRDVFDNTCVFDSFSEDIGTTNSILQITLPLGTKVLLTILRKLYIQRGRGRRESALRRGLDQRSQRLVPGILDLLTKNGLATCLKTEGRQIWYLDRTQMARIGAILATPHESKDEILVEAGEVS